jgi:hypothetical protein
MEAEPVSERLGSLEYQELDKVRKPSNPEFYHHQNPLESTLPKSNLIKTPYNSSLANAFIHV